MMRFFLVVTFKDIPKSPMLVVQCGVLVTPDAYQYGPFATTTELPAVSALA
jgi:hypothetical protein